MQNIDKIEIRVCEDGHYVCFKRFNGMEDGYVVRRNKGESKLLKLLKLKLTHAPDVSNELSQEEKKKYKEA